MLPITLNLGCIFCKAVFIVTSVTEQPHQHAITAGYKSYQLFFVKILYIKAYV